MKPTLRPLILAVSLAVAAPLAHAAFTANMSEDAIRAEIQAQLNLGQTPEQVAQAALAVGAEPAALAASIATVAPTAAAAAAGHSPQRCRPLGPRSKN